MIRIFLVLFTAFMMNPVASQDVLTEQDLSDIREMMVGTFSTENMEDTSYYHIVLCMEPVFQNTPDGYYLYVEQALYSRKESPYRQRVYHLSLSKNAQHVISKVFEIENPERFIGGCDDKKILADLNMNDLIERPGCELLLTRSSHGFFEGKTPKGKCISDFRGASYVTSDAYIDQEKIITWDRGWNDKDEHVWGPEKGGYVFEKTGR